ncbi:MAG: DUF2791 family P-loop domain-containing protein [SAR324 cluster bacterium]|nr:DUF2791 family P-loop domain-containing protein [SAR324 cluster bacterium]
MNFQSQINQESSFHLRQAMERLREGIFDPVAVRLLTAHEDRLQAAVNVGLQQVSSGKSAQLFVRGSYGQGKSHSLAYIQDYAQRQGYVTSMINLDPRELPLHQFKLVYGALMENLKFPDRNDTVFEKRWKQWVEQQFAGKSITAESVKSLIPENIPHLFRCVLTGLAMNTVALTSKQKTTKKHMAYRPREFSPQLARVFRGETISYSRLQRALKYRQVDFYREQSLVCRGFEPYWQMLQGLSELFRKMGYGGWVILFDEGESMAQANISMRNRNYQLLQQIWFSEQPAHILSVFAFTDDFFHKVESEDYDRQLLRQQGEEPLETPYFEQNYAQAWRSLNQFHLQALTAREWDDLAEKLTMMHTRAYDWSAPDQLQELLRERLKKSVGEETRYRLKGLVDQLDLEQQALMLKNVTSKANRS